MKHNAGKWFALLLCGLLNLTANAQTWSPTRNIDVAILGAINAVPHLGAARWRKC